MRGISIALALALLVTAALGAAQDAQRGVPAAMRAALIGCWDLSRDETVRLEPEGERGLRAVHSLPRGRHGGPTRYAESVRYLPARGAIQMGCRPRSQHGQFCEVRLRDDGALDVEVYARRYGGGTAGGGTAGQRVETLVARRCGP